MIRYVQYNCSAQVLYEGPAVSGPTWGLAEPMAPASGGKSGQGALSRVHDPEAKALLLQSFLRKGVSLGYVGRN